MESPSELWRRLCFLFQARRFHREMEEELRFHLEEKTNSLHADGMTSVEARRAAHARVGNLAAVEARSRDAWGVERH